MSWNVSGVGKVSAVAKKIASDFDAIKCAEPEETIKRMAADTIAKALGSIAPEFAARVSASGSQYVHDGVVKYNQLKIEVEPLWGFVE